MRSYRRYAVAELTKISRGYRPDTVTDFYRTAKVPEEVHLARPFDVEDLPCEHVAGIIWARRVHGLRVEMVIIFALEELLDALSRASKGPSEEISDQTRVSGMRAFRRGAAFHVTGRATRGSAKQ